jgi:hypothetical protein
VTGGCNAITGGAFVPAGLWPADYDGEYLFSDYTCGKIFRLEPAGGGAYTASEWATGLGEGSAIDTKTLAMSDRDPEVRRVYLGENFHMGLQSKLFEIPTPEK